MERLLESGRAVSFLSLVTGGSEEEEHGEKMEAGELSLTEAGEDSKAVSRKRIIYSLVTRELNAWNVWFQFFICIPCGWSSRIVVSEIYIHCLPECETERTQFKLNVFYAQSQRPNTQRKPIFAHIQHV